MNNQLQVTVNCKEVQKHKYNVNGIKMHRKSEKCVGYEGNTKQDPAGG